MPKTKKAPLAERVKNDPALLRRVLKNPSLRSKLPSKYLTPKQRQQRKTNARLRQPIVRGSSITERELAREARASMDVQFGGVEAQQKQALGESLGRERDVGSFYDNYLRQVAAHAQNVTNIGNTANTALTGMQGGLTGLSAANLTQLQNPAVASAQARGMQAGDLSQMASNAAAVRQGLVGSFIANQAGVNAANQIAASGTANVVAPGQKLQAGAMERAKTQQVRQAQLDTAKERGAADVAFRAGRRADEAKQVLAMQTLGANVAENAADAALERRRIRETERSNRARERSTAKTQAQKDLEPNKYGIPAGEWRTMSTGARQKVIRDWERKSSAKTDKPKGKGPDWVTQAQSGAAMTQLTGLKDAATRAKTGLKFEPTGKEKGPGKRLNEQETRRKILSYPPIASKLKHPVLVDAAVDAAFHGYIRNTTVKALIAAGYKPSEVARALKVMTSGQVKTAPAGSGRT
jgi:hypothetical protein